MLHEITKLKMKESKRYRIGLIPDKEGYLFRAGMFHWHDAKYVLCGAPWCDLCNVPRHDRRQKAQWRFGSVVIDYETNLVSIFLFGMHTMFQFSTVTAPFKEDVIITCENGDFQKAILCPAPMIKFSTFTESEQAVMTKDSEKAWATVQENFPTLDDLKGQIRTLCNATTSKLSWPVVTTLFNKKEAQQGPTRG